MVWERHQEWLEEIVPKGQLFFYDVKDGWEPLCKALKVPVPKDTPFPQLNDSKAFEDQFRQFAQTGLLRWALVIGCFVGMVAVLSYWMR